jgi:hypothetical protein
MRMASPAKGSIVSGIVARKRQSTIASRPLIGLSGMEQPAQAE